MTTVYAKLYDDESKLHDRLASEDTDNVMHSDKEIGPDQLSSEHGEGHGHSKEGAKASMLGSSLNIANTIMGAGILALPNVIAQFGIIMGSGIIAFSYVLTYISCSLLLKAKNLSHHSKYISIGKYCFGSGGLWAVKVIIIVNNMGLCVVYLIIFSSVASNLLKGFVSQCQASSPAFFCHDWFLILMASVLVSPFVFAKSMAKLQGASAVAVLSACIFSLITIIHFFQTLADGTNAKDINVLPNINSGGVVTALSSVTSVFLAFTFQFNFFPVYKSLSDPTDARMKKTALMGLTLVLIVYLSVANCGYLTFGAGTTDLLNNFTRERLGLATFIIINIAFLISSILTLPLMFFGAKNEVYGAIKLIRRHFNRRVAVRDADDEEETEKDIDAKYGFRGIKFYIYVTLLFLTVVGLAIAVPNINVVFSFVGSTAANGLNFVLPSLFYLRLCSKRGRLVIIAKIMVVLGVVMGIVGIVTSALSLN